MRKLHLGSKISHSLSTSEHLIAPLLWLFYSILWIVVVVRLAMYIPLATTYHATCEFKITLSSLKVLSDLHLIRSSEFSFWLTKHNRGILSNYIKFNNNRNIAKTQGITELTWTLLFWCLLTIIQVIECQTFLKILF